ncbi:hypothetical protein [Corynebacterium heidelbergense]|uniref:Uncharacterized protein n=1 Tax=Corynebacterium heidelbergense TaxID=2055947 RepID=A0A364VE03_9CORY|nr:hypothetical protein [Corynebacterium heidelbergense]RAV34879.1 hypothetical protein CWC39_00640 [Corynebacterium heidelbergense]WCZ36014.1 hypothetical protein CHEID_02235 [Corynebacterium heidelbergense]
MLHDELMTDEYTMSEQRFELRDEMFRRVAAGDHLGAINAYSEAVTSGFTADMPYRLCAELRACFGVLRLAQEALGFEAVAA